MRSHAGHSSDQRARMCYAKEVIRSSVYRELYEHVCVLEKTHYGRHKCWCECVFGRVDPNLRQLRLIEIPWDDWKDA